MVSQFQYEDNEEVVLWTNTVGPYHNRQETYLYFSLPFCRGPKESISHYHETLGEALQGVELEPSGIPIDFKGKYFQGNSIFLQVSVAGYCFTHISGSIATTPYCEVELDDEKLKAFSYAVKNHYWYQLYLDDLPIWGVVGEIGDSNELSIFTHKKFEIAYNGKQIVDVNLTSEGKVRLEKGTKLHFTYEVSWKSAAIKFEDRFDKYLDPNFFQHRVLLFE